MFYGHLLTILGRWHEAAEQVELAVELDRLNPFVVGLYGTQLAMVGRTDDAIEILQEMRRNNPGAGFGRAPLADALHEAGRYDEALALKREIYDSRGEQDVVASLDLGLREGGYTEAWARAADTLVVRAGDTHVSGMQVAVFYAKAGESEKAVNWVEIMVEQRDQTVPYIGVFPLFRNLHDHTRFRALVMRLGLPLLTPEGG